MAVTQPRFMAQSMQSYIEHTALVQGLRACLEATMHIKGLLEMMFDKLAGWINEFITDMEVRSFINLSLGIVKTCSATTDRLQLMHLSPGHASLG